ncbi:MAG: DUF3592 domain-containing protein [Acidiferrobacterales bacterium]|nr:DUF3592 domain-containing protein [Acidiferrobacterales bacterium]
MAIKRGSIWLKLFATVFIVAGLAVAVWGISPLYQHLTSAGWEEANAQILQVEQVISRGDGGTSYGVKGRYRYRFGGNEYVSDQLNFYSGTDNIGDYQTEFYARLHETLTNGSSMTAWVNPNRPEEAYIDRTLRVGLLVFMVVFGSVFTCVGIGVLYLGRYQSKKAREEAKLESRHSAEPWRWREEWQGNAIKSNAGSSYKGLGIFAVLWNLISLPIALMVFLGDQNHPIAVKLLILIFPLAGVFLFYLAYKAYRNWNLYGNALLRMRSIPFSIGHRNEGEISVPGVKPGDDFIIKLSCIKKTRRRSGSKTRTTIEPLWQSDRRVKAHPGSDNVGTLPYIFDIPADLPESSGGSRRKRIEWQVSVKGSGDTDLSLEFEVPGFVTDQSKEPDAYAADWNEDTLDSAQLGYTNTTGEWYRLGVIQRKERGGTHYYFPAARNLKITLGFPIFGLVFLGVGVALFFNDGGLFLSSIFSGMGLLFLIIGLRGLLFRSEIRIADQTLFVRHGFLGMSDRAACSANLIRRFKISSNMRSGNTAVYRLEASLQDGEKILLARNLLVKSDVEALVNQFLTDLDLPVAP